MILKQLNFDGCLSYIAACRNERAGIIIDPSHVMEPYIGFVKENGLKILYVVDTHTHVDHISLAPELADAFGAKTVMSSNTPKQREIGSTITELFGIEKIIEENSSKRIDILLKEGEELRFGGITFRVFFTPGHTQDSMCLIGKNRIFTGDTLLIGQCGRTDLPGGSPKDMYESLFNKLINFSDDMIIYPAHDYRGNINTSLGYEKINNVCLNKKRTPREFEMFLKDLFPPLNADNGKLQCGLTMDRDQTGTDGTELNPLMKSFCISMEQYLAQPHETTIIGANELFGLTGEGKKFFLLDVRQPEELSTRGFIKGSINIPVVDVAKRIGELPKDLNFPIVTICESGARSSHAALYLRAYGYNNVKNLEYGIRGWRTEGYPISYPEN